MRSTALLAALLLLPACDDKKSDDKADTAAKGKDADGKDAKAGDDTKDGEKGKGDPVAGAKAGGGGGDSLKYIPDAATVVFGMDVVAITKNPLWETGKESFDKDFLEGLELMKKCEVPLENWKSMTVGLDPNAKDAVTVVMSATGIGKKTTIECINKEMTAKDPANEWKLEDDGKKFVSKDATGFAVNDDLVVMANTGWKDAAAGLIGGKGASAADGKLKPLLGRVDQGKTVWVAATIPAEVGGMATAAIGAAPKDVTATIDLSAGLAVHVEVGVDNAAEAAKKAQTQWDQAKGMAAGVGVPQSVTDSVKIASNDTSITVDASATADDLKKISESVKGKL
ncbi:MAG: hypothetical protein AAF721_00810 [Myxococcota bacterium]